MCKWCKGATPICPKCGGADYKDKPEHIVDTPKKINRDEEKRKPESTN